MFELYLEKKILSEKGSNEVNDDKFKMYFYVILMSLFAIMYVIQSQVREYLLKIYSRDVFVKFE